MKRKKVVAYVPQWDGAIKGWAVNYTKNNIWRVGAAYELAELMQDSYMYFLICKKRYKVLTGGHFMSLYKQCLINHFNNLSVHRFQRVKAENLENTRMVEQDDCVMLTSLINGPAAVKELLLTLTENPGGLEQEIRVSRRPTRRETVNEYFCRLVGSDPKTMNLRQMVIDCIK